MDKPKLKWYGPLNRWLTEAEHQAHVSVEGELKNVYDSIMADAIPVQSSEPAFTAATTVAVPYENQAAVFAQFYATANVAGQYNALQVQGLPNGQSSYPYGGQALNQLFGRLY